MNLCLYYQAHVVPRECWYFVAIMRSFEHLCFDRTYNVEQSIFEFFVPADQQQDFLELMSYFQKRGIIQRFEQYENRLADRASEV
jgi:hypothetical protein